MGIKAKSRPILKHNPKTTLFSANDSRTLPVAISAANDKILGSLKVHDLVAALGALTFY